MAILKLEDGTTYTDWPSISRELSPIGIQLNRWPVGDDPQLKALLDKASLSDDEKDQVLVALDRYFNQLQQDAGYQSRDLIVIHPDIPNLSAMLSKFDRVHTHADDEVRYIIEGEGIFGFVRPDGSQVELTVQPEEYINVPTGTEHWFYLTDQQRIKAVRYFVDTEGWVPQYTDTAIRFRESVAV